MTINKIIRELMTINGVSLADMAKRIGKDRGNDISARLTTKNMSFDKAIEMLDVLGYKIVITEKDTAVNGYTVESTKDKLETKGKKKKVDIDQLLSVNRR